jgi:phage tail tape-measure protein
LSNSRRNNNGRTSEEIVNQRALATASERQARSTSRLVGAYANLSAQVAIASQRYQDLIVRGRLATQTQRQYDQELRVAQREFTNLQNRVLQADRAVGRFNRNVGNYPKLLSGLSSLMSAFGIAGGLTLFAQLATDAFNLTKELQALNKAMLLVTGSQTQFIEEQEFLIEIADAFGIELVNLTKLYTQFYVSAKDKISSQEIQDIFRSISKAAASMGLNVQQQERAFLALNQMMSKGTIQAEELRGQLG